MVVVLIKLANMKLFIFCSNCRNKIKLKYYVNDRAELLKKLGVRISLVCKECSLSKNYHVNDVKATESKLTLLFATMILFFGTGIVGYLVKDFIFGASVSYAIYVILGMILVPSIIYIMIKKQERDSIRRFNEYWV